MSLEEQQTDELEALAAIYQDDFNLISKDKLPTFSILIKNQENRDEDDSGENYELELLFTLPSEYPQVAPTIEILSSENLEDCDELEILDELEDVIQENLGVVMIFTLVSHAMEWINALKDRKTRERIESEERKKREEEEREQHKFEGTRVTVESFINWKLKFDEEMQALKKISKLTTTSKLTGKEMFMQDKNLAASDLNFENVENDDDDDVDVQVDESLFLQDEELLDDE